MMATISRDLPTLTNAALLHQEMVKSRTLPFVYDDQLPTRFGILPRYAKDEAAIRWFEVPAVMMFHVANAWQEEHEVKLVSCCFDQVGLQALYLVFCLSRAFASFA